MSKFQTLWLVNKLKYEWSCCRDNSFSSSYFPSIITNLLFCKYFFYYFIHARHTKLSLVFNNHSGARNCEDKEILKVNPFGAKPLRMRENCRESMRMAKRSITNAHFRISRWETFQSSGYLFQLSADRKEK